MRAEQLALILAALVGGGAGFARDAVTQEAPKTSPTLSRAELLRCVARLSPRRDPRIIAYGDSVTRGVFFNLVELLNSTDPLTTRIHAGHSANYSLGCARVQTRPPLNRSKCAAFDYTMPLDAGAGGAVVPLAQADGRRSHPPSGADGELLLSAPSSRRGELQLSFSLKTFGWEPAFDEDWLRALRRARRRPDAIVVGFGLWDMLYPPANDPARSVDHFRAALARFARELRAALGDWRRSGPAGTAITRGTSSSVLPRGTRVYWLTLPAIAASRLPAWKRGRMSDEYARAYNAALAAELSSSTWRVVDTHRATLSHGAEDTADGIHYRRASLDYTQQLLADLCRDETRDVPGGGRGLGVRARRGARRRSIGEILLGSRSRSRIGEVIGGAAAAAQRRDHRVRGYHDL